MGCEKGAAKFLNAAIEFDYAGEAQDLLRELASIEKMLGRPADHARNISRTIDLDLLYIGELEIETAELQLPIRASPTASLCCGRWRTSARI